MNLTDELHEEAFFLIVSIQEDPTNTNGEDPVKLVLWDGADYRDVSYSDGGDAASEELFTKVAFSAARDCRRPIYDLIRRVYGNPFSPSASLPLTSLPHKELTLDYLGG